MTFCKRCGVRVGEPLGLITFFSKDYEEFKDGIYCSYCARRKKWKANGEIK